MSLTFTGTRIAYKVNYSGSTIATVSRKQQFDDALKLVSQVVEGKDIEAAVEEPQFNVAIVLNSEMSSTPEVANAIIDNTKDIVETASLMVNGVVVARAEKSEIDALLAKRLDSFKPQNAECESHFVDWVTTEMGYYMSKDLDSLNTVGAIINSLSVVTEAREVTEVTVPYNTTVQKTNEQVIGYQKVKVEGVSGVARVTQDVVFINGKEQSRNDVSTEVVVDAVDEVIVKGTATTLASAKQKQAAHSAGFIFPLPAGSWEVSAYFGDGRGHKAIDLRAKSGTSIYAVADGKVVFAGWDGAYGYCVVIEHKDGTRTRYAHAKQLCCAVGDTVSQGEAIAFVGSTGQSTGNHLHFEVIVNGRSIDPAPYIGLD